MSFRKGFDMKLRSARSRRAVVCDNSVAAEVVERLKQSCWASMPQELLREVLVRIEEEEGEWPARRHVAACAGVCRSWREIMKEMVKTPEASGKLTFPINLKQPGPRDTLLQCFIKRNRTMQTYTLYLGLSQALTDNGKFLLAAKKCRRTTCTDYIISLDLDDMSKSHGTYIGKLRSNFIGTKFTVYDATRPYAGAMVCRSQSARLMGSKVSPRVPIGNHPVCHITYEVNVLGSRGPRRMQCVMDSIPESAIEPGGVAPTPTEFPSVTSETFLSIPFFRSKSTRTDKIMPGNFMGSKEQVLTLKNKSPRWHEQLQCWCLNFRGRVTVASVKNFQLVASPANGQHTPAHDKVLLQFGKVAKDLFTMDYSYPLSAFQAFAICLSSFDTKIACE